MSQWHTILVEEFAVSNLSSGSVDTFCNFEEAVSFFEKTKAETPQQEIQMIAILA